MEVRHRSIPVGNKWRGGGGDTACGAEADKKRNRRWILIPFSPKTWRASLLCNCSPTG